MMSVIKQKYVCIFTRQSWILDAFGELASGYPHRTPDCNNLLQEAVGWYQDQRVPPL
jgi:hypothetical protein